MKIKKFIKAKKVPLMVASGVILAGLAGGGYYLASKQDSKMNSTPTKTETATEDSVPATTDPQVQQNIDSKATATDGATTTPAVVAATPTTASLKDGSLTILLDSDKTKAYPSFYGAPGTYGIEKLVSGNWAVINSSFNYSGHGGSDLMDTIYPTPAETHYRVFKLENGARTAVSGDTVITWQQILTSKDGTMSVPLAE